MNVNDISIISSDIYKEPNLQKLKGTEQILFMIQTFFKTKKGSYLFNVDYGTELYKYLFKEMSRAKEEIKNVIQNEISYNFGKYLVRINDIDFVEDDKLIYISLYLDIRGKNESLLLTYKP